ncbi:MAG: hypothetical protein K2Q14_07590 [Gammaproteobacteria bacterium]|nr:hypothetical protein [Gammaproteobacteria bacterium]
MAYNVTQSSIKLKNLPARQQGAVLFVALMILLILTFIGISTLNNAPIQEKIADNYQETNRTFQAANSVEREAETFLAGLSDTSSFNNTGGLYTTGNAPDAFATGTWTGTATRASSQTFSQISTPQYFIELIGSFSSGSESLNTYNYGQNPNTNPVTVFRIVVYATDTSNTASTLVQSFYGVRF